MSDYQDDKDEGESILDYLQRSSIMCIDKKADGSFNISECCDWYFDRNLSKDDLLQLAVEIFALAEES